MPNEPTDEKQLHTVSHQEKQALIEVQIAEWISNGYKREDLFVTPSGSVIYDSTAAEAAVLRDFDNKSAGPS